MWVLGQQATNLPVYLQNIRKTAFCKGTVERALRDWRNLRHLVYRTVPLWLYENQLKSVNGTINRSLSQDGRYKLGLPYYPVCGS
jgi:hypothetical protein